MAIFTHQADTLPRAVRFNALNIESFGSVGVPSASANTTVLGVVILPFCARVPKVAVNFAAATALDGSIALNVAVGLGAYTQGLAGVNSLPGTTTTTWAVAGQALFAADVPLSVASDVGPPTGVPAQPAATATGGGTILLVPTNIDVLYPAGTALTLRASSPSGSTVTGLNVALAVLPVVPRGSRAPGEPMFLPGPGY